VARSEFGRASFEFGEKKLTGVKKNVDTKTGVENNAPLGRME